MSIAAYLDPRAVNLRLQSQTRDDILRELVHLIPELHDRAAEQMTLWQALADREKLHTTAVCDGLAFPTPAMPSATSSKNQSSSSAATMPASLGAPATTNP